jgi:hypothetical protein
VDGEERPHLLHRLGEIDVASPHPPSRPAALLLEEGQHGQGLGVVDEDEVGVGLEPLGVVADTVQVGVLERVGPRDRHALEGVVDELRDREELVRAVEELPFRVDPQVLEEGDVRGQELGHAAPEARAAHVEKAGPLEGMGRLAEPLDRFLAGGGPEAVHVSLL